MNENIPQKLLELTNEEKVAAISKGRNHIILRVGGRTFSGAHCEQRLGMSAVDYYMGESIKALWAGVWEWQHERCTFDEQLIKVIDSKISEEVRKYKVERKRGLQTQLVETNQLALSLEQEIDEEYAEADLQKFSRALELACQDNEEYQRFVYLKHQGLNYEEICKQMGCTKKEAYRLRDSLAKKANRILKSL